MATPEKVFAMVEILAESFRQKASEATYAAYEFGFSDISDEALERATALAIRQCQFMPTVKELRDLATGMKDQDRAVLAWESVSQVQFNPYTHVDFDDPVCNATIRNLGGWPSFIERFTDSEAEKWARKDFIDTYQRLYSAGVNGDACRPLAGLSQVKMVNGQQCDPVPERIRTGLPPLTPEKIRPAIRGNAAPAIELKRA